MINDQQATRQRKKERSPSYPAIDLETALDKVRLLYKGERRNFAPVGAVIGHWGYGPKSSSGLLALAALKKFGLIVDEGTGDNRRVKISDEAFSIIVDERLDSPERLRLIQAAALKPVSHAELWEKYKTHLPSDSTLRYELSHKGFTESGTGEFLDEYKKTIQFAKLDQHDILSVKVEDKMLVGEEPSVGSMTETATSTQTGFQTLRLPLTKTVAASISLPLEMDEKLWKRMLTILEAMKPGILNDDEDIEEE